MAPGYLAPLGYRGMDYTLKLYKDNPFLIWESLNSGFVLSVWIINDTLDYDWAFTNGFAYVTTDRPDLLVEYTVNKPEYWRKRGTMLIK